MTSFWIICVVALYILTVSAEIYNVRNEVHDRRMVTTQRQVSLPVKEILYHIGRTVFFPPIPMLEAIYALSYDSQTRFKEID